MKIAYLILAHNDPAHLKRLISSLDYNSDFYVHIDKKKDIEAFTFPHLSNVFFIEERVHIYWAHISMVEATLNLMASAMSSGMAYKRYTLISGACYPLKHKKEIYNFLSAHDQTEFIRFVDMRPTPMMSFIKHKWYKKPFYKGNIRLVVIADKVLRRVLNLLKTPNEYNGHTDYFFGSQWWSLTEPCCRYIIQYISDNPNYLKQYLHTFSPDEHFFHTIVGNSKFRKSSLGVVEYRSDRGNDCYYLTNLHFTDPSLSKWFTVEDLNKLLLSEKLFVRKVSTAASRPLLEKLDILAIKDEKYIL